MSEDLLQTVYVFGEILDRVTSETCDEQIVQVICCTDGIISMKYNHSLIILQ